MTELPRLRAQAREIFLAGVKGADPAAAVRSALEAWRDRLNVKGRSYRLSEIRNLCVIGCGKASVPMARAAEEVLGERIASGIVIVKHGQNSPLKRIEVCEAGHPIPDAGSVSGAERAMELARRCNRQDLCLFLISGGASALLCCPAPGLSLEDKQNMTDVLLKSGAPIHEVNAVRKHISRVKGGRLAELAAPAPVISLILSDVIDDAPETVGSGPTAPDPTTYADCLRILQQYCQEQNPPAAVVDLLQRGARHQIPETLKPENPIFETVQNVVVGNNGSALAAARERAQTLGYRVIIVTNRMQGESRLVARQHAKFVRRAIAESLPRPTCFLSGGETTVRVIGDGAGGRNQEFALAAALEIENLENLVILSGGTDGADGPTQAAGAIIDGTTMARARRKGLDGRDYLARNDSHHFLLAVNDLLVTGPTGTNVMDLQITLVA